MPGSAGAISVSTSQRFRTFFSLGVQCALMLCWHRRPSSVVRRRRATTAAVTSRTRASGGDRRVHDDDADEDEDKQGSARPVRARADGRGG